MQTRATGDTPEYRRQVREAAVSSIPKLLEEAGGKLATREIHASVKQHYPALCDDSIACHCGVDHPSWDHSVDWALQALKKKKVVHNAGRGFWRLGGAVPTRGEAVTPPPQPVPTPVATPPPAEPPEGTSLLELIRVHLEEVKRGLAQRIAGLSADQFEQLVAEFLTRQGYSDVRRTGGPGDRNVDITATYGPPFIEVPLRVQVKHRQRGGTVGPSDVAAFRDRAGGVERVLLMVTNERLGPAALDTASEQGRQRVHVVQGDDLLDAMIDKRIDLKEGPLGLLEIDEEFFAQF